MAAPRHALVVADGDVDGAVLAALAVAEPAPLLIAADGGAGKVLAAGLVPDLVVGDFDSLSPADRDRLEALGVELRSSPADKDESDLELCLLAALETGARDITIVGALGIVRPEHSIANLLLLGDPRLDEAHVVIVGPGARIRRIGTAAGPSDHRIEGRPGDFVSLLPLDAQVSGVTTDGLRFPLHEATLVLGPTRGLSNQLIGTTGRVTAHRGRLLVVHTDASTESEENEP